MRAIEQFMRQGIRLELADDNNVRAIGTLTDHARTAIKSCKPQIINELQWRELERLLAIVAPAYNIPADEYPLIREIAQSDLPAALACYRDLARRHDDNTHQSGRSLRGISAKAKTVTPADERTAKMVAKLKAEPGLIYAMQSHDEVEPDAVILTLAIRGKGTCELRIPKSRYDAFALLELIEKHTTRVTLQ